jgi:hypothetical protein
MSPWNAPARALALAVLTILVSFPLLAASDVVTVGTVTASGPSVDVPIYIRDVAGTSLGADQPAGSKIQSYTIRVAYSPASAVQSVSFNKAGITAGLASTFESQPSTANSRSLIITFPEAGATLPFTLNASAPGNLVARMAVTLSSSAQPGTSVALTLDPSVTLLSDEGGTGAKKETVDNGRLALVDGAINIPQLSVSLSPSSRSIETGSESTLTASLNITALANTTINLSSQNTSVASVPATVVIEAGRTNARFDVDAIAIGTSKITATLGSSTSSSNITVTAPEPSCPKPAAPQLTAPATALVNTAYSVSWNAVTNASDYVLEESTTEDFASPISQTLTATSASFTHANGGARYYYRARARNRATGCDVNSNDSQIVSVLITDVPPPLTRVLTVVGSTPGNFGSFFKTSVQLYNAHDSTISGKLVFHAAGAPGNPSDPSLAYSLAPGQSLSYDDLLPAMGLSGLGSVDLVADGQSPVPLALARVFNDAGAAGTTGLTLSALAAEDALRPGVPGVLLAPADVTRFRFNIGVRALEQGAAMNVTVRSKSGEIVKTLAKSFGPTSFSQVPSQQFLDSYALASGDTITIEVTSGAAFVYGSTTDNITNDPSVQLAMPLE